METPFEQRPKAPEVSFPERAAVAQTEPARIVEATFAAGDAAAQDDASGNADAGRAAWVAVEAARKAV